MSTRSTKTDRAYGDGQFTAGTGSAAVPGLNLLERQHRSSCWNPDLRGHAYRHRHSPLAVSCFCFRTALGVNLSASAATVKYRTYN